MLKEPSSPNLWTRILTRYWRFPEKFGAPVTPREEREGCEIYEASAERFNGEDALGP